MKQYSILALLSASAVYGQIHPIQELIEAARTNSPGFKDVRVQFVRSCQFLRARHGDGMSPSCAALSGQQVVIAVPFVEMGSLGKSQRRALEDQVDRPHQLALRGRVLLQHDPRESIASRPMVPAHIDQVLSAVIVVEQRRIEAAAVEVNRIRPLSVDDGRKYLVNM